MIMNSKFWSDNYKWLIGNTAEESDHGVLEKIFV
jgi:hypothetical protein